MGTPVAELAGEILPQAGEQGSPFCISVQFTLPPFESFCTVAEKGCVVLMPTLIVAGASETVMAGTVMVMTAVLVESVIDVAVSMRVRELAGGVSGAVKRVGLPLSVVGNERLPQAGEHTALSWESVRVQVTPWL